MREGEGEGAREVDGKICISEVMRYLHSASKCVKYGRESRSPGEYIIRGQNLTHFTPASGKKCPSFFDPEASRETS